MLIVALYSGLLGNEAYRQYKYKQYMEQLCVLNDLTPDEALHCFKYLLDKQLTKLQRELSE